MASTQSARKPGNRSLLIDSIKGLCILFVVITHFPWSSEQRTLLLFPFWIDMAVPVFMLLSGYLTANSMEKNHVSSFEECYHSKRILKSIVRLTSPYLIAYFVEMLLYVCIYTIADQPLHINPLKILLLGGIGPGSYYFPIMIQFVFLFPLIYRIIRSSPPEEDCSSAFV